jgi:hypothetical protein
MKLYIETCEVADRQERGVVKLNPTTSRMTAGDLAKALNLRRTVKRWKTVGPVPAPSCGTRKGRHRP